MLCTLSNPKISDLFNYGTCLISNSLIPLIFALAAAGFTWGVIQFFIFGADEEAKREKGKQFIIWGLVALTVMFSVWGLVRILRGTFGLSNNSGFLPCVNPDCSSGTVSPGGEGGGTGGGFDPCLTGPVTPDDCPPKFGN